MEEQFNTFFSGIERFGIHRLCSTTHTPLNIKQNQPEKNSRNQITPQFVITKRQ
jgi:hypothetical protein